MKLPPDLLPSLAFPSKEAKLSFTSGLAKLGADLPRHQCTKP